MDRNQILREIRRTAEANGGRPLGQRAFERTPGGAQWRSFWARWSEAVQEAGLKPNTPPAQYPREYVAEQLVGLARRLGHFPTWRDWVVERRRDPALPGGETAKRMGGMDAVRAAVFDYCKGRDDCEDVLSWLASVVPAPVRTIDGGATQAGVVYLFKSGRRYKIGKTTQLDKRTRAFKVQLPDPAVLVHALETDDIDGIEVYWHKRYEKKRVNGEFFELSPADVHAFRRRRRFM